MKPLIDDDHEPLLPSVDENDPAATHITTAQISHLSAEEARLKRQNVIQELVESERQYIANLSLIIDGYLKELKNIDLPQSLAVKCKSLFSNIPRILEFHELSFINEMEKCPKNYEAAGEAFVKYDRRLYTYYAKQYCKCKPKSDFIMSQNPVKQVFNEIHLKLGDETPTISDLLMAPIHRIKKYQLFLKDIQKCSEVADDPLDVLDRAFEVINIISKACDNMTEFGRLTNFNRNLNEQGDLFHVGLLQMFESEPFQPFNGKERIVFIFDYSCIIADIMPNTDESNSPVYVFKHQIMVNKMVLEVDVPYQPLRFVLGSNDPNEPIAFLCQTSSEKVKEEWLTKLKARIDRHVAREGARYVAYVPNYRLRRVQNRFEIFTIEQKNERPNDAENETIKKLKSAIFNSVLFSAIANCDYDGPLDEDDDCPIPERVVTFKAKEFLQIKEKYNDNWWIGRLVKEGSEMGFVPSLEKMEEIQKQQQLLKEQKSQSSCFGFLKKPCLKIFKKSQPLPPYNVVPTMRPVVIVGPSLKGYEVTDLIQKKVFEYLKNRFEGRVIITNVKADIGMAKVPVKKPPRNEKEAKAFDEIERIYDLAQSMNLLILDCDAINHPKQLEKTGLAPIFVYIKISSPKVLQKLIKLRGKSQTRYMNVQTVGLEKLSKCPEEMFEVILDESQSEIAYERLGDYLESYWQATHPSVREPPEEFEGGCLLRQFESTIIDRKQLEIDGNLKKFVDDLNSCISKMNNESSSSKPGPSSHSTQK